MVDIESRSKGELLMLLILPCTIVLYCGRVPATSAPGTALYKP